MKVTGVQGAEPLGKKENLTNKVTKIMTGVQGAEPLGKELKEKITYSTRSRLLIQKTEVEDVI